LGERKGVRMAPHGIKKERDNSDMQGEMKNGRSPKEANRQGIPQKAGEWALGREKKRLAQKGEVGRNK